MLKDHKIVAGTFLTNAICTGYHPISKYCLNSIGSSDYVDIVLVSEGRSIDDTRLQHESLNKVVFVDAPSWPINSFSYANTADQYSALFDWCNNQQQDVILTLNWGDTIYSDLYCEDLRNALSAFIDNKAANFMNLPGESKVLNRHHKTALYPTLQQYYTVSAYKFTNTIKWNKITNFEKSLIGTVSPVRFGYQWRSNFYAYEMFSFSRKNLEDKIKRHCEWNNSWTVDQIINNKLLDKARRMGIHKIKIDDHPQIIREYIENKLTIDHYGWSNFGHLE